MSPESYNAEILQTLKDLRDRVVKIEGILLALCSARDVAPGGGKAPKSNGASQQKTGGGVVAEARDLDGQYGDPTVKKDPKQWPGESYAGCKFSECPADYLDILADLKDWMADKDEQKGTPDGTKYAKYGRLDAARARGWSERKRNGWVPPERLAGGGKGGTADDFGYDSAADDIPF